MQNIYKIGFHKSPSIFVSYMYEYDINKSD